MFTSDFQTQQLLSQLVNEAIKIRKELEEINGTLKGELSELDTELRDRLAKLERRARAGLIGG